MERAEQRSTLPGLALHSVQVGVDLVGEIACGSGRVDGIGRAAEDGPQRQDEVLPGGVAATDAGARQRKVLQVQ